MNHTDHPTTWRDLADRLTPEQFWELEYCETHQVPPGLYSPESALRVAQMHVRNNEANQ